MAMQNLEIIQKGSKFMVTVMDCCVKYLQQKILPKEYWKCRRSDRFCVLELMYILFPF